MTGILASEYLFLEPAIQECRVGCVEGSAKKGQLEEGRCVVGGIQPLLSKGIPSVSPATVCLADGRIPFRLIPSFLGSPVQNMALTPPDPESLKKTPIKNGDLVQLCNPQLGTLVVLSGIPRSTSQLGYTLTSFEEQLDQITWNFQVYSSSANLGSNLSPGQRFMLLPVTLNRAIQVLERDEGERTSTILDDLRVVTTGIDLPLSLATGSFLSDSEDSQSLFSASPLDQVPERFQSVGDFRFVSSKLRGNVANAPFSARKGQNVNQLRENLQRQQQQTRNLRIIFLVLSITMIGVLAGSIGYLIWRQTSPKKPKPSEVRELEREEERLEENELLEGIPYL